MSNKPVIKVMPKTETVSEQNNSPGSVPVTPELKQELERFTQVTPASTVNLEHYRPKKKAISIRLDADVLSWFQAQPGKYQQLINKACRDYMTSSRSARNQPAEQE